MWSAVLVLAVSFGVAVGIFPPVWVVYCLTIALGVSLLFVYIINRAVLSLFGKPDEVPSKGAETTQFRIFSIIFAFYLSMWLAYLLK